MLRGDRVIAVDANPDAGNLAHRVAPPHDRTITDVLRDLDAITSYAALRRYTSQAVESRLEVLASDDDPRIGMALDRDDYHRLIGLLDRFYNLILLDTGTGILDSANQGLLSEADQIVLVVRAGLDGGRRRRADPGLDGRARLRRPRLARRSSSSTPNATAPRPPEKMRRHFEKTMPPRRHRPLGRRPRARSPDRHDVTAPQDPGQPRRHRRRGRRQLRRDRGHGRDLPRRRRPGRADRAPPRAQRPGDSSPAARHDPEPRSLDLLTSAHPTSSSSRRCPTWPSTTCAPGGPRSKADAVATHRRPRATGAPGRAAPSRWSTCLAPGGGAPRQRGERLGAGVPGVHQHGALGPGRGAATVARWRCPTTGRCR